MFPSTGGTGVGVGVGFGVGVGVGVGVVPPSPGVGVGVGSVPGSVSPPSHGYVPVRSENPSVSLSSA